MCCIDCTIQYTHTDRNKETVISWKYFESGLTLLDRLLVSSWELIINREFVSREGGMLSNTEHLSGHLEPTESSVTHTN